MNPIKINGNIRFLSVGFVRFNDDKISKGEVEAMFEPKNKNPSDSIGVDLSLQNPTNDVFSDGGQSLLSAAPVDVTQVLEPTFTSLGLAHGYPSGWVQSFLEVLHMGAGLEWWQAIGLTTVCLRIIIFPIMVTAQKNMVNMNHHLPTTQKLQVNAQLASLRGNHDEAAFANKALNNYMLAENCHPFKSMLPVMTQGMFFATMFFGLRGMANVPVESLKTGGLGWFTDLTVADPLMILPIVTASTIYLQIYLNADGMNTDTMPEIMKKLMYLLPLISVPIMINFPAALNIYWLSNNLISLVQARVVKHPEIRKKLGIGEIIHWKPEDLPMTTFYEEMKKEMKIQRSKEEKKEAGRLREQKEFQEEERKKRQKLLAAFEAERKQKQSK